MKVNSRTPKPEYATLNRDHTNQTEMRKPNAGITLQPLKMKNSNQSIL